MGSRGYWRQKIAASPGIGPGYRQCRRRQSQSDWLPERRRFPRSTGASEYGQVTGMPLENVTYFATGVWGGILVGTGGVRLYSSKSSCRLARYAENRQQAATVPDRHWQVLFPGRATHYRSRCGRLRHQ